MIEQRLSLITLGVDNLQKSRHFYEHGLGWGNISSISDQNVCFLQMNGFGLALYPRALLAEDAKLPNEPCAFGGITLAYNTRSREEVDRVLKQAEKAGASILKPAQEAFWGGYSGYFADLDGHPWEVAWNPGFALDAQGNIKLPE